MSHKRLVCICGKVLLQCRCPGPHEDEVCPNPCSCTPKYLMENQPISVPCPDSTTDEDSFTLKEALQFLTEQLVCPSCGIRGSLCMCGYVPEWIDSIAEGKFGKRNVSVNFHIPSEESKNKRLEAVAAECHKQWSGWTTHLLGKMSPIFSANDSKILTLDIFWYERWMRQVHTEYKDLIEEEKEADRREARKILEALRRAG